MNYFTYKYNVLKSEKALHATQNVDVMDDIVQEIKNTYIKEKK